MHRNALLLVCVLAFGGFLAITIRSDAAPGGSSTPPPVIYRAVTTALCARLHERVRPAIAMILQNDRTIDKSPPLFNKYARGAMTAIGSGVPNANGDPQDGDSIYNRSPETSMALQQMSYLVLPIARNIIAAQTLLDDAKLVEPTGNPADDQKLAQIKRQLLETIAFQSASLDLINGFVQTLQMGELQHAGEEYLGAIQGNDTSSKMVQNTPNPWQDPNTPGLAPNPYAFDVTTVPGLAVGYNPLTNIVGGLQWLKAETKKREDDAGSSISGVIASCAK